MSIKTQLPRGASVSAPTGSPIPVEAPPEKEIDEASTVDRPPHYTFSQIEPIDVIEVWDLGFHLGNAVKYIARARHKGSEKQDLKKALWYINRYLSLRGAAPLK